MTGRSTTRRKAGRRQFQASRERWPQSLVETAARRAISPADYASRIFAHDAPPAPFAAFAPPISAATPLRAQITAACRIAEEEAVAALLPQAEVRDDLRAQIGAMTMDLVAALRRKGQQGGVEGLVKEYSLSSQEGVALMCLAEALLRIPDNDTRDALIRDKIAGGDWAAHLGDGNSLFVNAATWGLMVTGKLTASHAETGLAAALTRLIARAGEPVIRRGVDMAMQLMGEQFVTGETIEEALKRARKLEAAGFAYSYDMLGEACRAPAPRRAGRSIWAAWCRRRPPWRWRARLRPTRRAPR